MTDQNVLFSFGNDDAVLFDGVADGSTWNGFDNVRVTPATLGAIKAHFEALVAAGHEDPEVTSADYWPTSADPDGLISLANGFATNTRECECGHSSSFHADRRGTCWGLGSDLGGEYDVPADEACACLAFVLFR